MACGVPVISSNSGGLPEVNIEGYSGYLSDVGDIDAMSKNAVSILKDENKLKTFKENAKEVASRFDILNIVPMYEKVYQEAIDAYKKE